MRTGPTPSVTVIVPTYREAGAIDACLDAIAAQTYSEIAEVLVVDGRSEDDTRERASSHPGVTVLDNPDRIQAAALNIGIGSAAGDVIVRVDGHCLIAPDYVERCVEALEESGAVMVGGGMTPVATHGRQAGIAAAMASRFGAGPATFHSGDHAGWTDTVYLGAYRREDARSVGGYAADLPVNEDAEFAIRLATLGGVWFDPSIRSTYTPRGSLRALARQYYRYGRGRAETVRRHPGSLRLRQLAAPLLLLGLASPRRRSVAATYAGFVIVAGWLDGRRTREAMAVYTVALPVMHLTWGSGFLIGVVRSARRSAGGVGAGPVQR